MKKGELEIKQKKKLFYILDVKIFLAYYINSIYYN